METSEHLWKKTRRADPAWPGQKRSRDPGEKFTGKNHEKNE
ncbi:MAG: hypothetical protein ABSG49_02825 [Methanoregula sp.]|jgi:hypothetical protein